MPNTELEAIHVAVAVIENSEGQILISKRPEDREQGGLWEFPGGKIEIGENTEQALKREIDEELALNIQSSRPLIHIRHRYPDYSVSLNVRKVIAYSGDEFGCEGQKIAWVDKKKLLSLSFPEANYPIITAVLLPPVYFISPDPESCQDENDFISKIEKILAYGCKLIQFRSKSNRASYYRSLLIRLQRACQRYGARLLVNDDLDIFQELDLDGIHLSSPNLMRENIRPVTKDKLLAVSCHNEKELTQAERIDVDFIVLGTVNQSDSHPGIKGLGWHKFLEYVENTNRPVYALGGMKMSDLDMAWQCGAQGIALISDLWNRTLTNEPFLICNNN